MNIEQLDKNLVRIQKVKAYDKLEYQIGENQRRSYQKFLEQGVYEVFEEIAEELSSRYDDKFQVQVNVRKPVNLDRLNDLRRRPNIYYPVDVRFIRNGQMLSEFEAIRIPYCDEFNVLNVNSNRRVLLGEIRSEESLSFKWSKDQKELDVTISLPRFQFSLKVNGNGVSLLKKTGKSSKVKISAMDILDAYLYRSGMETTVDEIIENSYLVKQQRNPEYVDRESLADEMDKLNAMFIFNRDIGELREVLDETFTFEYALDETLAEDIVLDNGRTLREGHILTHMDIEDLQASNIFKISVRRTPYVIGNYLDSPVTIRKIKKDAPLNSFLTQHLHGLESFRSLPIDIDNINIVIPAETVLTKEVVEILTYTDVKSVSIRKIKSKNSIPVTVTFKQEILTNAPITRKKFISENKGKDFITPYDFAALVSYVMRVYIGDVKRTFNRDKDFTKKISLANEIFKDTVYKVFFNHITKFKTPIATYLSGKESYNKFNGPFMGLHKSWISELQDRTLLRIEDDVNPMSLMSQISQTVYAGAGGKSVSDDLRTLSLPLYGRLCPYETPQSKKIGLVNTISIGCKIIDGVPYTPYFKLRKENGRIFLTEEIEYLSPKQEQQYSSNRRIGDLMSLDINPDTGEIKKELTLARIRSAEGSDEQTSVADVLSTTLTHVNVLPEQHLSPTAMMIPFMGANDGARVAFGMSLMKQALCLLDSDVPYVTTSMYRDIYNYSGYYIKRAEKDGVVKAIESNRIIVQYAGETKETIINVSETRVTDNSITIMNYKYGIEESFKKGDILVDSSVSRDGFFSPGVNCLVAYICDGWNYEDGITVSESLSHKLTSLDVSSQKEEIRLKTKNGQRDDYVLPLMDYRYARIGDNVLEKVKPNSLSERSEELKHYIKSKYNGLVYKSDINKMKDKIEVKVSYVDFKPLNRKADKMAGRHGNKGVITKIKKDSIMPQFNNGKVVDILLNPSGVVSRMNIGQILDAKLGFCGYLLGMQIESDPFNGAHTKDVADLIEFLHDVANESSMTTVRNKWSSKIPNFIFERAEERYEFIKDWENCFNSNGTAKLFNPETGEYFEYPIEFGYAYMIKTVQMSDKKAHNRAGNISGEAYSQIDKQPPKGAAKKGGQRIGEMEGPAILAHGAASVFHELVNVKSDNVPMRTNLIMDMFGEEPLFRDDELIPRSVDMLRYSLEAAGVHTQIDKSLYPDYTASDVERRRAYNLNELAKSLINIDVDESKKELYNEFSESLDKLADLDIDD